MNLKYTIGILWMISLLAFACDESPSQKEKKAMTAQDILGNPDYLAISYGGYRQNTRDVQPTVAEVKEDLKMLSAIGVRILRTYNTELDFATTVLKAIRELKAEDTTFEMYVMVGAWIACENSGTEHPNHEAENVEANTGEVQRAVEMAKNYPDIVKVIAVGNEAMVKWAAEYFVQPWVILKWVTHLQELKKQGELPKDLWITSSDNFASWGGGGGEYHVEDLTKLIKAVDFISMHTYPMHDTHYNPAFWGVLASERDLSKEVQLQKMMERASSYAKSQFDSVTSYVKSLGIDKPIHIGETGWASSSNGLFSPQGSRACDEYKEGLYYQMMRDWTKAEGISCFYFEGFDEPWKDGRNPGGSENHFGLFTVDGQAKFPLWSLVDQGVFDGLGRNDKPVTKTFAGDKATLLDAVNMPPLSASLILSE
ncbi:MAG: hypothetical protein Sapg2KO_43800 [Saprospiraceae bacterium]